MACLLQPQSCVHHKSLGTAFSRHPTHETSIRPVHACMQEGMSATQREAWQREGKRGAPIPRSGCIKATLSEPRWRPGVHNQQKMRFTTLKQEKTKL
jgi:hypothetical protein